MRARVHQLEAQIRSGRKSSFRPALYEKELVGFAFKGDVLEPLKISNRAGFEGQNAIRAPLVSNGQTIGSMYIEADPEKEWDPEEEKLANTVAQQASLQIQSLRLRASAERARVEAEEATRRFMHESWASYLDAIHQNERIGYAYDQASVTSYLYAPVEKDSIQETVKVLDEQVGVLSLKPDPNNPLSETDRKLIAEVANQMARQVENIRLLADASRARAEAEEATRRLTHESWETFTTQHEGETLSFLRYHSSCAAEFNQFKGCNLVLSKCAAAIGQLL
jgi:transcriptional regulator with GAF, ATPase, and Fis domain